jgi:hypothetical protein
LAFAVVALALTGCGNIAPWFTPYARLALAEPNLGFDPNPVSASYLDQVSVARDGARGAMGSAGGGCGCN